MSEVKKCLKCCGELEKGVMQFSTPRGGDIVFWGAEDIEEKLISQGWPWQIHDHQAWRCKKCHLAVFLYEEKEGVKP
jgi:hypothetical protein